MRLVITSRSGSAALLAVSEFAVEPTYSQTPAWWCTPAWQPSPLSIADSNPLPGASCSSAITTMVVISHDKQRKQNHLSVTCSVTVTNSLPIFPALKQTTSFTWLAWHRIVPLCLDRHLLNSLAAASERCCTVGKASSLPNKSRSHVSCLLKLKRSACSWILSRCLPFAKGCSHPSLAFSLIQHVSFLLVKKRAGEENCREKLWMRNASKCAPDLRALQLKCTFLSLASPRANPTGYGQDFYQHIRSKYSANWPLCYLCWQIL